jgi:hypothetical protein
MRELTTSIANDAPAERGWATMIEVERARMIESRESSTSRMPTATRLFPA